MACYRLLLVPCLILLPSVMAQDLPLRAFPGAEGFGATTRGGRGGSVYFVTTLADYDPAAESPIPGSLRAAVDARGPRYIIFRTSGTIDLKVDLWIRNPFLTIAGQSAPGDGICFRDYQVVLSTHDVILRHLRFRSGDRTRKEQMAVGIFGGNNSILDHCSMSWAIDEVMSSFGTVHNLTVQWSIIAEGLSHSFHPKGEHSKGSILDGDGGISIHHSIYAHHSARNPRVNTVVLDFRNNIVYNWGYRGGYTTEGPSYINYVDNYFKPGPSTRTSVGTRIFEPGDLAPRFYFSGNFMEGSPEATQDNKLLVRVPRGVESGAFHNTVWVKEPFEAPPIDTDTPERARDRVLAEAGATLPRRDSADLRLVEEIRSGTGRIIDSPSDTGGWPVLNASPPPVDGDSDGMPDAWETENRLNPADGEDYRTDSDGDGYPNLEEWLNATNPNDPERGHLLDLAAMHALQRDALERCAEGKAAFVAEKNAVADRLARERQEKLAAINLRIESRGEGRRVWIGNDVPLDLVSIPAGSFLMGSPEEEGGAEDERPQQPVTISRPFYMGATLITNRQFVAIMGPTERRTRAGEEEFPAHEVTWFEAMEFCALLSEKTGRVFRLPTEAEWEYACRAGTTTAFYTGDTITSAQANFDASKATRYNPVGENRGTIVAVGQFTPNPWGLFDMHGNQAQYCLDKVGRKYSGEPVTDPQGPPGDGARVLRGGKASSNAVFIRSAARYGYAPGVGYGFRIVLESGD